MPTRIGPAGHLLPQTRLVAPKPLCGLIPERTFADPERIRDLARRGGALGTLEAKQMLEQAIETGRGGLYLDLTHEQYAKLTRP
jgi:hypothetical protein